MSRFPTMELSEAQYEYDGLRFMTVRSPALNGRGDMTIFVPKGCEEATDMPVSLLLHGVYGSHWAWALCGGAHRVAQQLIDEGTIQPMVLVMPSDGLHADGSGYLPLIWANYEQWIMEDVRAAVCEGIPQIGKSSKWFIAGLSMGGYGALRLGAKYAGQFFGISAHSSITHFNHLSKFIEDSLESYGIQEADEVDVVYWMEKNQNDLPPLRFDCGRDDVLIEENQALNDALTELGIPHRYQEFPGEHSWDYWTEHLEDTLRFFNGH
jgi:putative tributyrin esterase